MRSKALILLVCLLLASAAQAVNQEIPSSRLHLPPEGFINETGPREDRSPPTGEEIVNPAEFCRAEAMIINWTSWHSSELVGMCLAVADDDRVICCVSSSSQQTEAYSAMNAAGVNMANIEFFDTDYTSVWIRDYGPFCIHDDGVLSITGMGYGGTNNFPINFAQEYGLPWYRSNLEHHGGNHICDGNGMGFFSDNLTEFNYGWSIEAIREEMRDYLGLDSVTIFGTMAGDMTGHCDMFVKLLNDTLFVVSEYAEPGDGLAGDYDFLNNLAELLGGMQNVDGRDFSVARLPLNPYEAYANKTYTNSLILNDKVLVPIYNTALDAPALQVYADCLPGHEIIGIDSEDLIEYLGAIHCISNTLHHENPLIVLHDPLLEIDAGQAPLIECRLNPRFADREVELHYSVHNGGPEGLLHSVFGGGIWRALMPPVYEDFDYWFVARAYSGDSVMETFLPEGAPTLVFTCDVQNGTVVDTTPMLSRRLAAWPNPCNPRATLGFALARESAVELAIYDVTGRLRRRLLTGETLTSGGHEDVWDGCDGNGTRLPSGVYLARLETGFDSSTERIVLLK